MDAVGTVGRARADGMHEDNTAFPFLDLHRMAGQGREFAGEAGQFVVVRGEQGAGFIDGM